jgi:WD40 repeat protein
LFIFQGDGTPIYDLEFSPGSKFLLSRKGTGKLQIWNIATAVPVSLHRFYRRSLRCVAFTRDDQVMAMPDPENNILIWNLDSQQKMHQLKVPLGISVAISSMGKYLVSSNEEDAVLWDLTKEIPLETVLLKGVEAWNSITSDDGRFIAIETDHFKTWIFDRDLENGMAENLNVGMQLLWRSLGIVNGF